METAVKKKPLTRFGEFELLKAIAIIGLPAVHVMEEAMEGGYASPGLMHFGSLIVGLCAFGPSVFMMCMGLVSAGDGLRRMRSGETAFSFFSLADC